MNRAPGLRFLFLLAISAALIITTEPAFALHGGHGGGGHGGGFGGHGGGFGGHGGGFGGHGGGFGGHGGGFGGHGGGFGGHGGGFGGHGGGFGGFHNGGGFGGFHHGGGFHNGGGRGGFHNGFGGFGGRGFGFRGSPFFGGFRGFPGFGYGFDFDFDFFPFLSFLGGFPYWGAYPYFGYSPWPPYYAPYAYNNDYGYGPSDPDYYRYRQDERCRPDYRHEDQCGDSYPDNSAPNRERAPVRPSNGAYLEGLSGNGYITHNVEDYRKSMRKNTPASGNFHLASSAREAPSELRPAVKNAIEALRAMPPEARQRLLDSDRYRSFSAEERELLKQSFASAISQ